MKHLTNVFITDHDQSHILLARKKRGFGADLWNGYGGKMDATDATLEDAAIRELFEESTIKLTKDRLEHLGIIDYIVNAEPLMRVYIYRVVQQIHEVLDAQETEEMAPQWFAAQDLPFAHMWQGDDQWLPNILTGTPFAKTLSYDEHDNLVASENHLTFDA